jgi:hypothetical protein
VRTHERNQAPAGADQARGLRKWWLDKSLRKKSLIVVAVPLIALMGITSANLLLNRSEDHERGVSRDARALDSAASQVLADAVNALREAAVIEGDGRQQPAVDATTGKELSELAQLRSAISRGRSGESLRPALENGKTTMDSLRIQVAKLASGPTALVAIQHNKLTMLQRKIELLDIAGLARSR